jgi:hypothetical protein
MTTNTNILTMSDLYRLQMRGDRQLLTIFWVFIGLLFLTGWVTYKIRKSRETKPKKPLTKLAFWCLVVLFTCFLISCGMVVYWSYVKYSVSN